MNRKSPHINKKVNLIAATNQNCKISEQYRTIRTNFLSSIDCVNSRTLIITSPNSQEGKSTTSANFAISLALQGKKVLLIDANMRNPILDHSFKIGNTIGLSSVLNGRIRIEDTIGKTEINGLDLLTSGPVPINPTELLGSQNMESLVETTVGLYDVVVFDTPPILEVSDAKILANLCDGLLLVIRSGKTKSAEAIKVKKLLKSSKSRLLGIILNDTD
ncbi:CpsD/CapB family tyrosine-protein kinase [Neobacillus niacini]|uniref:CpsD/CapB family tyrosine-protein kinase n=1 Tax=Neobacillus niacini TaxID=86668 RepID=UPI003001C94F